MATKMTKTQLSDECERLRQHAEVLEQRLASAADHFRAQRARIAELEAALAAQAGAHRTPPVASEPVVTYYTDRFGRRWEKTRVGNRATSRCLDEAPEHTEA